MAKARPTYRMMDTACPRCGSPSGRKCIDYRGKGKAACRIDNLPGGRLGQSRQPTQAELFAFFETPPLCLTDPQEGPADDVP